MAEMIVPTIAEELRSYKTADGESSHDYEIINLWYSPEEVCHENLGLAIKCRCKNCGRIISVNNDDILRIVQRYTHGNPSLESDFDYEQFFSDYGFYDLPFDVKYIYDDGRMKIVRMDKKGVHKDRLVETEENLLEGHDNDIHMVKVNEI